MLKGLLPFLMVLLAKPGLTQLEDSISSNSSILTSESLKPEALFVPLATQKPLILQLNPGYGFLIPHRPVMRHIPVEHVPSLELYVGTQTNGKGIFWKKQQNWSYFYRYPKIGFSLLYSGTGNKDMIGNAWAFLTSIDFNVIKGDRFNLIFRPSIGPGWIGKTYDKETNEKSVAIGSHFNMAVRLGLYGQYNLGYLRVFSGMSLTHFSNGALTTPNLGINLPAFHLGVGYQFNEPINERFFSSSSHKMKYSDIIVTATAGIKENAPAEGRKYGIYNFQSQYRNRYTIKSAWLLGLDVMYNTARINFYEYENGPVSESKLRFIQPGINIGFAKWFGRMTFFVQNGVYLLNHKGNDGRLYHRVGGNMLYKNGWMWHFALKSHLAKADHFEIGIGKRLWHTTPKSKQQVVE